MIKFILLSILSVTLATASPKTCDQFKTYKEAKSYYDTKKYGYRSLDKNHDGKPCEILLEKELKKEKSKARIRIYQYGSPSNFGREFSSLSACNKEMKKLNSSHKGSDYSYKCESL